MKLAEALAERGELIKRTEHLKVRILANARHQDGESPAEDAGILLSEYNSALDLLEVLIRRINRTNSAAAVRDGTITDALASRDVLRMRHKAISAAADAASGRNQEHRYGPRQLRSELVYVAALPVAELRSAADDVAKQIRLVDLEIQRVNWEFDLVE
ncbi:DIP1984 family protein [Rhodococcus fascians]|nr:DIP1984 family protein [Rhodococcus fascians]MBY4138234.1 DIP1984 family protein [Rhodococcus fascians]MBY4210220.1 DIP1984 family protein [Rhodococcus fascians]MBY4216059.1 DIP1984 family protein [Rhodococcus fascians]MBY4220710.1 DIP1984 family protein [Rhodococcus fascians]